MVGCLTTLPMLFSGIVFIRSFATAARKDEALGANLIGALVGALLQSVTLCNRDQGPTARVLRACFADYAATNPTAVQFTGYGQ
jgi:hypothetical protein